MIRTTNLTKYYGSTCAVSNLSIQIEGREIVGFLGKNGAGKTTTLRMLAGILSPSSGFVEIEGEKMASGMEHRFRRNIGFLPDRPPLYEDMTVYGYLEFAAGLRGYDQSKTSARVEEVLKLTALIEHKDHPIGTLSHGYRQRVGIAQAIVHEPALVILDEPISGLDPDQIREMRTLVKSLKGRHTVLLSSHNLNEVSQTCDRLLLIDKGKLVAEGTADELMQKHASVTQYIVELKSEAARVETTLNELKGRKLLERYELLHAPSGSTRARVKLSSSEPQLLAEAVVQAGLGLRVLRPEGGDLETVFTEIVRS